MLLSELIARYGVLIVFLNVFGSSVGLPLPASPTLIMVGASMSLATGGLSSTFTQLGEVVGAAVIGGVLGDLVWFQCGKRYGVRTLYSVCKLLMARQTCIGPMQRFFGRWGVRVLVVARFVPGLSFVSVLLCGVMAIPLRSFILQDGAGLALWASVAVVAGAMFAATIERTVALIWRFGWQASIAFGFACVLYGLYRRLRAARHEGTNMKARIGAGAASVRLSKNVALSSNLTPLGEDRALPLSLAAPCMTTNAADGKTRGAFARAGRPFDAVSARGYMRGWNINCLRYFSVPYIRACQKKQRRWPRKTGRTRPLWPQRELRIKRSWRRRYLSGCVPSRAEPDAMRRCPQGDSGLFSWL
ncbi:DedA family protein [Paraburkholderia sp.]|uniref:DedA family protein n=1 Tax=Paraburkholderia sp. TaxID=1926495 RepID=UPI0025CC9C8B|nr:DedA family protein [Paraburkholderia sp.]